jgi:hypothetical protein
LLRSHRLVRSTQVHHSWELRSNQLLHNRKRVRSSLRLHSHKPVLHNIRRKPIHNRKPVHNHRTVHHIQCHSNCWHCHIPYIQAFDLRDQTRSSGCKCYNQEPGPLSLLSASLEPRLPYRNFAV